MRMLSIRKTNMLANALEVSADMLLVDVLYTNYAVKDSLLADKLDKLSTDDRNKIYDDITIHAIRSAGATKNYIDSIL